MLTVLLLLTFGLTSAFKFGNFTAKDVVKFRESFNRESILEVLNTGDDVGDCQRDIIEYLSSIGKEPWASKMFDSMEKILHGLEDGNMIYLGHFDECISVQAPNFRGQYCMLEAKPQQNSGLLEVEIQFGLCVPSSCTASDLTKLITEINEFEFEVFVDQKSCWTSDPLRLNTEDYIALGLVLLVLGIAVCSTVLDVLHEKGVIASMGKRHDLYTAFSFTRNGKQLLHISESSGNVRCLHGIRFLTMCWVVLAHEYAVHLLIGPVNSSVLQNFFVEPKRLIVTNGFVSVDSFFFMSGMLVCLVFFRDISKKKSYDVPLGYIHRYIRLTPPFAVMILLQATVLPKFSKGPLWYKGIGESAEICRSYWWEGLVYLQNFIAPNSTCLGQSWYLSVDMQMFWLAPLLLYPMFLWPKLAIGFVVVAIISAASSNFAVAYINDLGVSVLFSRNIKQFELDYVQICTRLTPYVVGIGFGYLIAGVLAKKVQVNFSKKVALLGWLCSATLCLAAIFAAEPILNLEYDILESASYLSLHRLAWALGLGWVVFACISGYGGPVNTILSWKGFEILGKLSYSVFLVHFTFQYFRASEMRTRFFMRDFEIVCGFFGDLAWSVMLSIPLTLLFEMPFISIDRYFLSKVSILPLPRPKSSKVKQESVEKVEEGIDNDGYQKN